MSGHWSQDGEAKMRNIGSTGEYQSLLTRHRNIETYNMCRDLKTPIRRIITEFYKKNPFIPEDSYKCNATYVHISKLKYKEIIE